MDLWQGDLFNICTLYLHGITEKYQEHRFFGSRGLLRDDENKECGGYPQ
jgi:hypothetical protein